MKKLFLSLVLTLGLVFGFNSVNAAESNVKNAGNVEAIQTNNTNYIYVTVYENGVKWIYVYTEDGIFVTKYEDS